MSGHGWVTPLPNGQQARCGGPPLCSACVAEWEALNAASTERCRCGQALRRLNPISPWLSCVGCGVREDGCVCAVECYRPTGHEGEHGEPASDAEDDARILFGRCGARDMPLGVLHA